MPLNSRQYFPSETGKESSNEELIHTASFGCDAFPDIDNVSPCTTQGGTFNSVTSALVSVIVKGASTKRNIDRTISIALIRVKIFGFIFIIKRNIDSSIKKLSVNQQQKNKKEEAGQFIFVLSPSKLQMQEPCSICQPKRAVQLA